MHSSDKVKKLLEVLSAEAQALSQRRENSSEGGTSEDQIGSGMSAIVFVKERNATATLAKVIMDAAEHMPELRGVKVGFVVGGQTSFAFKA